MSNTYRRAARDPAERAFPYVPRAVNVEHAGPVPWNVYIAGRRVATVDLAARHVGPFRTQLADQSAQLRLAAWETGTLR